ncbi:conserved phage C-terminal domain-containing protein [Lactobacillus crispatus]|uniref:conserved phage C-terminal domain-containing protein n=1 Tax=Lactobacillus crispatus TaxID=47770 RepID=UPI00254E4A1D|nr:conserved phage C-terminal domain-containing protein [Lactobacillus crispatus]MDK7582141.1 conserved phage C-terminal domain-containing protein [Lactobacillus crispatus]
MSEKQVFEGSRAFLMIPPAIARDKELLKKPKTIILMGEIISMLNVTGEFFMSNKKIAERLDVSARTVNEYLGILESKKLIERTKIISQENGAIVGRQIRAGVDLVKPTSHKYNSNNRTVEDTYSSADAEPPIPYKEIIDYLNKKTNQHLRYQTKAYQKLIRQRFEEGATLEDFKKAIDNQAYAWQGTRFWKYMRPSTLFQASKFDSYVNANDLNQAKQPSNGGYGGEPNISDIPDDDLPF